MNKTTLEIAEYIASHYGPCTLKMAAFMQETLGNGGFDFSRATRRELTLAIGNSIHVYHEFCNEVS